ncbi:hypothetical protein AAFN83_04675 [Gorillibacterium sp. CAU 1737]
MGQARTPRSSGCLIVFEGVSGSGKTEGINRLKRELDARGVTVSVAEWNANRFLRRLVRLLDRCHLMNPIIYSTLQWIGFRLSYETVIKPRLKRGEIVIADRYIYSGQARDTVNGAPSWIGRPWHMHTARPDTVFFCDTLPAVCYHRIVHRGKALYHPSRRYREQTDARKELAYLESMRDCYLKLFAEAEKDEKQRIVLLTDSAAVEVLGEVWEAVVRRTGRGAAYEMAPTADRSTPTNPTERS